MIKSHGVMTMQGDTAYRTESSGSTYDPPLFNDVRQSTTVIEGKYTGACRDGLRPGDMVRPTDRRSTSARCKQERAARGR